MKDAETTLESDDTARLKEILASVERRRADRQDRYAQLVKERRWLFAICITGLLIFWLPMFFVYPRYTNEVSMNELGDSFGVVNSLFSGLALVFVVVSIYVQGKSLDLQNDEVAAQRDDLALSVQNQMTAIGEQRKQNQQMRMLARRNATIDLQREWNRSELLRFRASAHATLRELQDFESWPSRDELRVAVAEVHPFSWPRVNGEHTSIESLLNDTAKSTEHIDIQPSEAEAILSVLEFWERVAVMIDAHAVEFGLAKRLFGVPWEEWRPLIASEQRRVDVAPGQALVVTEDTSICLDRFRTSESD